MVTAYLPTFCHDSVSSSVAPTALEGINVILDMRAECILLAEGPCAVFEGEAFISNAEETLQRLAFHRNALTSSRWQWLFRRVLGETVFILDSSPL